MMGLSILEAYRNYRRFQEAQKNNKYDVAFYSEQKGDLNYFGDIIEGLALEKKCKILYLTSDPNDKRLENIKGITHICIGDGLARTLAFQFIQAPVFVMTLPDLNSFQLKRSVHPGVHYVYIFHSIVSTHMIFREKAYDSYDTILCVGPHHRNEILEREALRQFKPKRLIDHGYARLDQLLQLNEKFIASGGAINSNRIVIAPSWGPNSISNLCIEEVLENLSSGGFEVIYRPHPMTTRQNVQHIPQLQSKFANCPNIKFDLDITNSESLLSSAVLISDWSGVALEFSLTLNRPALFINTPKKINNPKYTEQKCVPMEIAVRSEVGLQVELSELSKLRNSIDEILKNRDAYVEKICRVREKYIYNLGKSDKVAIEAIFNIIREQQGAMHAEI